MVDMSAMRTPDTRKGLTRIVMSVRSCVYITFVPCPFTVLFLAVYLLVQRPLSGAEMTGLWLTIFFWLIHPDLGVADAPGSATVHPPRIKRSWCVEGQIMISVLVTNQ